MDKQLIERIALESEQAAGKYSHSKVELTVNTCIEYHKRIDAERGNKSVGEAFNLPGTMGGFTTCAFKSADVPAGSKLFLSPTIPEGMTLVPIEPTHEMLSAMNISGWMPTNYRTMLAAAQGERK